MSRLVTVTKGNVVENLPSAPISSVPLVSRVKEDNTYDAAPTSGFFAQVDHAVKPMLNDPRDTIFVYTALRLAAALYPGFVYFFLIKGSSPFQWYDYVIGAVHLILQAYLLGPFTLMLHCTSHAPLFKNKFAPLNKFIPWLLAPAFGQTPDTYAMHHLKMHHVTGNGPDDLSSTMAFERDNAFHFLQYFGRFYFLIWFDMSRFFIQRKQYTYAVRGLFGEFIWFAFAYYLSTINMTAAIFTMILPFNVARFGMMSGNWAQHAFVDKSDAEDDYMSAITCINTVYNKRCFNDGYHTSHHLNPLRHFTEHPQHLLDNEETFRRKSAVVFDGLDYIQVWACLMVRAYGVLADHYVRMKGDNRTKEEIMAMLKDRTRPFDIPAYRAAKAARAAAKAKK